MGNQNNVNSKSAKTFVSGSLWIIGLSVVLFYSFAMLVLYKGCDFNESISTSVFILVCIIACLSLIAFICFFVLMERHLNTPCEPPIAKNGEPSSTKDENYCLKLRKLEIVGDVCLVVAKAIKLDSGKDVEAIQKLLKEMLNQFSKISSNEDVQNSET
jgi:hypothetical protein